MIEVIEIDKEDTETESSPYQHSCAWYIIETRQVVGATFPPVGDDRKAATVIPTTAVVAMERRTVERRTYRLALRANAP